MDKAALFSFLRHMLFLFIIIKMVNGILMTYQSDLILEEFQTSKLVPFSISEEVTYSLDIAMEFLCALIMSLGLVTIFMGVLGFYGAIYIQSKSMINFSMGVAFLLLVGSDLAMMQAINFLRNTFEVLVAKELEDLYNSVNFFDFNITGNTEAAKTHQFKSIYNIPQRSFGWHYMAINVWSNRSYIDLYQVAFQCCGFSGRTFWAISIPSSCCSNEYYNACTLMVAYQKPCISPYRTFESYLNVLSIECFMFSLCSAATSFCSLYLARMCNKYPDGNFGSEYSTSEEEDKPDFNDD